MDFRFQNSDFRLANFRLSGALAVAVLACVFATTAVRAEVIDRVLAVVSDQVITLSDVTAARDLGLESAPGAPDPIRAILSKLIDRELVLAEVERYSPPEPSTAAIDAAEAGVRARFPSAGAYAETLARSGVDEKRLRDMLRQNLRMNEYLERRFSNAPDRRQSLIEEWIAGLRRRSEVVDLYLPER